MAYVFENSRRICIFPILYKLIFIIIIIEIKVLITRTPESFNTRALLITEIIHINYENTERLKI